MTTSAKDEFIGTDERKDPDFRKNGLDNGLRKDLRASLVPKRVKIETMMWDVPVRVIASNPNQISLTSSNPLSVSVLL